MTRHARRTQRATRRRWLPMIALALVMVGGLSTAGLTAATLTDNATTSGSVTSSDAYAQRIKALNPLAYWRLGEANNPTTGVVNSGTVAVDSSGNGVNGTYVSGDLYFTSTTPNCPGSNCWQYVTLNVPSTYTIAAGDRFEYDVYLNNNVSAQAADFTTTDGYALRDTGLPDQNGVSAHPVAWSAAPNVWMHRVITIPSGNSLVGKTIAQVMLANSAQTAATQTSHFANIRITDTSGNIKKSFWGAGDPIPSITTSISNPSPGTNSVTPGTVFGQATASPLQPYAGSSGAPLFGGNANGVTVTSTALDMKSRPAFSVEFWEKSNALRTTAGTAFICREGAPGTPLEQYSLDYVNGAVRFYIRDASGNAVVATGGPDINDNQWHHIVGVYNSGAMTLYVDGVAVSAASNPNGLLTMPAGSATYLATRLGYIPANIGPLGIFGSMSEVAIYAAAMSPSTVLDHYTKRY